MNITFNDEEKNVINDIAVSLDVSEEKVIHTALRNYQLTLFLQSDKYVKQLMKRIDKSKEA